MNRMAVVTLAVSCFFPSVGNAQEPGAVIDRFWEAIATGDSVGVIESFSANVEFYEYFRPLDEFFRMEWAGFPLEYYAINWGFPVNQLRVTVLSELRSPPFVTRREAVTFRGWGREDEWTTQTTYLVRDGRIARIWSYQDEPATIAPIQIDRPSFAAPGHVPVLAVDAVHNTGHKIDGTLSDFAALARADGLSVRSYSAPLDSANLAAVDLFVIANPMTREEPAGSAFTPEEVAQLVTWVAGGGSLLLVSDHQPFAEGSAALAEAFGFQPFIGGAFRVPRENPDRFFRGDGSLGDHPITSFGADTVATLGGHAFQAPPEAVALLSLVGEWRGGPRGSRGTDEANFDLTGWLQGAALPFRSGRVVFLSEARILVDLSMFDNAEFALGLLRWLARAED